MPLFLDNIRQLNNLDESAIVTRLRYFDQIVGYKKTWNQYTFYSKDGLWWSGNAITYNREESQSNFRNQMGRRCYENDVLQLKSADQHKPVVQLKWDVDEFVALDLYADRLYRQKDLDQMFITLLFAGLPSLSANVILHKQLK